MMFSTNPFPHSTIHVYPPPKSFLDHEKDDLYINPIVSGDCFPAKENIPTSKHDLVQGLVLEECDEYNHFFLSEIKKNKPSKKDHHTKIHTAQGPRDRRVRLSIEVARKFFFLQDLLGVDKASKTLDWLFEKSKISIDELIESKKQSSSSSTEVVFLEIGSDENEKLGREKKSCGEGKRKKMTRYGISNVNQSRAEARARARERTIEKLNIKNLDHNYKEYKNSSVHVDSCSSNLTLHSRFWNSVQKQNDYSDKNGESVMEDKISMLYNSYHHNLDLLNEQSGDYATI